MRRANTEPENLKKSDLNSVLDLINQAHYKCITELNLCKISLDVLPDNIKYLHNLQSLNLSHNKLTSLPMSFTCLYKLISLNLSFNKFIHVPDVLFVGLRMLQLLDVSSNKILKFNDDPGCLSNILILKMSHNALTEIPSWIFSSICKLRILDISQNPLGCGLKPNISYYRFGIFMSLHTLNIENCNYKWNTPITPLSHFNNLRKLNIGNDRLEGKNMNYFGSLNMTIFKNIRNLTSLDMRSSHIATLPQDFDFLKCIEYLNLTENFLSWLPESFCNILSLKVVFLNSNQLLYLPKSIGNLKNLEQVHASYNKLYALPESFYKLKNLEYIDLYSNKIQMINPCILNNKNLKGIDFDMNYINLSKITLDCVSKNKNEVDLFENKYNILKIHLREYFNLVENRFNSQITGQNINDFKEISHPLSITFDFFEDDDESELTITEQETPHYIINSIEENDEDWEQVNCDIEDDDLFDPNGSNDHNRRRSYIPGEIDSICDNYCPANNHAASVLIYAHRPLKTISIIVEGQFDSD